MLSEIRLIDDDGSPLETPAEIRARHRAERMAQLRALLEGNPFMASVPASGRPRHASARSYPALHGFALAEAAVREGRAEWLPTPID
jgi:hypothetical protein